MIFNHFSLKTCAIISISQGKVNFDIQTKNLKGESNKSARKTAKVKQNRWLVMSLDASSFIHAFNKSGRHLEFLIYNVIGGKTSAAIFVACEQALCLGKKNSEEREGSGGGGGGGGEFRFSLSPSSPLDQRPVHRLPSLSFDSRDSTMSGREAKSGHYESLYSILFLYKH